MSSVDVEDISILNLTACDIPVIIDFKPLTEIQNNLTLCIKITLKLNLNLTACDIPVTIDFKPLTEIQNNLTLCIKIALSIVQVTNVTFLETTM